MDKSDMIIKDALKKNLKKLDDDQFSQKIVDMHLAKSQKEKSVQFVNFGSLLIGLSLVIISIGLIIILQTGNIVLPDVEITSDHGIILLTLSLLFSIYKWAEEVLLIKYSLK